MNIFKKTKTFTEGIREIHRSIPNIEEFLGDIVTEKATIAHLASKVGASYPSINNPEYPATCAISISAQDVSFKSRGFYSFGWRVNPHTGEYSFRVSFGDGDSLVKKNTLAALIALGWVEKDKPENK